MARQEFPSAVKIKRLHFAEFRCEGICSATDCAKPVRSARAEYCERHYYRLRRRSELGLSAPRETCARCASPLPKGRDKYCSDRCVWRASRATVDRKTCRVCGKSFENKSVAVVCSEECAERNMRTVKKATRDRYAATDRGKEAFRNKELVRKARKYAAPFEEFTREEIFERDAWVCGICDGPIPRDAKWPEPEFGTIDHKLPLSKGGAHTRANVQAAHLVCNCRKNDRIAA